MIAKFLTESSLFTLMYALIIILTTILTSIAIFPIFPIESLAHSDGCHRWHSCPSDDRSYVCGDLGYDDECGGSEEEDTDNGEDIEPANDDTSSSNDDNDNGDNDSSGDDTESSSPITSDNDSSNNDNNQDQSPSSSSECQGQADCFTGIVTEIVDGDTLDVNNVRVRLSLVNTPERGDSGYSEAKGYTESTCPIGSKALVDEDDGQKEGSFDRLIGLVYCGNEKLLLNERLLNEGHAKIFEDFCGTSEFSNEDWVQKFGC
jgi:endonuclease YncB( thermonuclease family)